MPPRHRATRPLQSCNSPPRPRTAPFSGRHGRGRRMRRLGRRRRPVPARRAELGPRTHGPVRPQLGHDAGDKRPAHPHGRRARRRRQPHDLGPGSVTVANQRPQVRHRHVITGLDEPTQIVFTPDGRMLIAERDRERSGSCSRARSPDPTPLLQLAERQHRRRARRSRHRARSQLREQRLPLRLLHALVAAQPRFALHRGRRTRPPRAASGSCGGTTSRPTSTTRAATRLRPGRQPLYLGRGPPHARRVRRSLTASTARSCASARRNRADGQPVL